MKTIEVKLRSGSYQIRVGAGLLGDLPTMLVELGFTGKAVIVSDATVAGLYGQKLTGELKEAGLEVTVLNGPANEEEKSLETAGRLYGELTDALTERNTPLLALGGGVIGDLTGFTAATYRRGVPLIQLPTTLLAQADSSIGGKTAVNHGHLKNMVGAFYQPRLTVADTEVLQSLSRGQIGDGLAEIIKHGAILDAELFAYLEDNLDRVLTLDEAVMEWLVARSAAIKAGVVESDELDLGARNVLNYGHTTGHAVETVSDFRVGHGQAVAFGMLVAGRVSRAMGLLGNDATRRIERLIERAGLVDEMPALDTERLLEAMRHDKKIVDGRVRFVLLRAIGDVFISEDVGAEKVRTALESLR